jgi:hypothetical protein
VLVQIAEELKRQALITARASRIDGGGHKGSAAGMGARRPPAAPDGEQLGASGKVLGRAEFVGVLQRRRDPYVIGEPPRLVQFSHCPRALHPDLHGSLEDLPPLPGDLGVSRISASNTE